MFRFFRRYQKTFIVVGGVILMFVFTVGDSLTQWMRTNEGTSGGRSPKATAVTWNGGKLTEGELNRLVYQRQLVNRFVQYVSQYGQMVVQTSDNPYRQPRVSRIGLIGNDWDSQTLDEVVVRTHILAEKARDMGIVISDNAILDYINELGMGQLGSSEMYEVLAQLNPTGPPVQEEMIYAALREELLAEAALDAYGAGRTFQSMFAAEMPVNRWEEWKQLNDRVQVEAAAIDPKSVMLDVPEPTDKELREYYDKYKDYYSVPRSVMNVELPSPTPGFMVPTKVSLQYLRANYQEFVDKYKQEVTEQEIAEYYEANKDLLFVEAADFEDMDFEETTPDDDSSTEPAEGETATEEAATEEAAAEESASEETATEEATTEESAEEMSEESTESTDEPTTEETSAEETPAEETTDEADEPAEEQSTARPASPFRLAAYQPESDEATDAAAEESSEEAAAPAEEMTDVAEETEEVTYQPLEEVADKIRDTLAQEKFFEEIDSTMQQIVTRLNPAYGKYLSSKLDAEAADQPLPEPPAELRNLAPIAEEYSLEFEETGELDMYQLMDTDVGKSVNQQDQSLWRLMFSGTADLYEPLLTADYGRFGDRYLVMKTSVEKTRQPKFEEIKDQVAAAWKQEKAAEIALERAKETAKEAQDSGLTLAEYFVDQPEVKVTTTPTFTYLTLGDIAPTTMTPSYRLSQPDGLTDVGPQFLLDVFKLTEGEVAAQPNFDKSIIYLVRIADQLESNEQLRSDFLEDANFWTGRGYFLQGNAQQNRQAAINAVLENVDLDWKRPETDEAAADEPVESDDEQES